MRQPKILLLQARHNHDLARLEERISFAEKADLEDECFVPFDLISDTPTLQKIRQYDALMIGGSGDYYVSKGNLPRFQAVLDVLAEVVETGYPTFASCFGFQLLVEALGGKIIYDPDRMEVGSYELALTKEGQQDELFCILPEVFRAQLGHKDRAERLPEGTLNLAASINSPYQALRVPGKPVWATQFHPELTRDENLLRFNRYLNGYADMMSEVEIQETLSRFQTSSKTPALIPRFLQLIFE